MLRVELHLWGSRRKKCFQKVLFRVCFENDACPIANIAEIVC